MIMSTPTAQNVTELGAAVRQLRSDAGLTQRQLADRSGVSLRWLVSLEKGRTLGAEVTKVFHVLRELGVELVFAPLPTPSSVEQEILDLLDVPQ